MTNSVTLQQYGAPLHITIRKSNLAKRIGIRITAKGAELVLPRGAEAQKGYNFLLSKECWIRKKMQLGSYEKKVDDNVIPIFGKDCAVTHINSYIHSVKLADNTVEIYSNKNAHDTILKTFLKNKLLEVVTNCAEKIREGYRLYYTNIRIIDSKSRWGCCSSDGKLSFNWCLVFAPNEVIKYLVVHEMSHLKEMNHSGNFWALVQKIYPEYRTAKLWLKRNGRGLYNYL